jgi:signal transduction histidine kinase/predicted hydrocarbon binding protein
MKPEINITDELLSRFCDVRPNPIAIDKVDKDKVFPREVNTTNFRSLLTTSAEVFASVEKVFSSILQRIDIEHCFIAAQNNPYRVEPFSFWHIFQDDYWISNALSTSIFDNSEKALRNTILGDDPLFEAGKKLGAHFPPWQLAAIKLMNPEMWLRFAANKNNALNKVKQITLFVGKKRSSLKAKYYDNITRTRDGALMSKSVCSWYRGCLHYYFNLAGAKEVGIHEISCTADGDDECIFQMDYRPMSLGKKVRNSVFHFLQPDFVVNHERALWTNHISAYNAEQLVQERTAELTEANNRLEQQIEARRQAEEELMKYRDQLEDLVEQRTAQLIAANEQLQQEIIDRKQAEEQARIRQEQLFQASKMASLGTLVSGVAHEINNPISFVMLNGPILQKAWQGVKPILDEHRRVKGDFQIANMTYTQLGERIPLLLSGITQGAKRVKAIVSDLKEFARQSSPELRDMVNVNTAVKTGVGLVSNLMKKSTNRFSAVYEPDVPLVKGNIQRIEQVIINLLVNACEALSDNHQAIVVSTAYDSESDCVIVEIQDEGEGMTPEVLHRIKDPFFTTKRDSGGTGLGLAISDRIITDHGGNMVFDSTIGYGTFVKVSLPLGSKRNHTSRAANGRIT